MPDFKYLLQSLPHHLLEGTSRMIIEEPSEPQNLQIRCRDCQNSLPVEIADLRENNFITCPHCNCSFTPDIDVETLLELIKETEEARLDSKLIM